MSNPKPGQALRDTIEMQSAAARFYGALASRSTDAAATKLLHDLARVEQLVALEIEKKTSQLWSGSLPSFATPSVPSIKTAPEWESFSLSEDRALALALDCTMRAAHYHRAVAAELDGQAAEFFEALGTSETQRANMLRNALRAQLEHMAGERSLAQALADTLVSVRRASKRYEQLATSADGARTRTFLLGMVDVCVLHAAEIERNAGELLGDDTGPAEGDDTIGVAVQGQSDGTIDLETAMRLASDAQKRAALLHGMLAHAYPGEGASLLYEVAEAERKHARTIGAVLDRLFPRATAIPHDDPASPLTDAPRESWTCPVGTSAGMQLPRDEAPSLRLVAG